MLSLNFHEILVQNTEYYAAVLCVINIRSVIIKLNKTRVISV